MKIGQTEMRHGLFLAPLAGFTGAVFRRICGECGAEYTVSEMISAKALCYNDQKTRLLARNDSAIPMALQLFGAEPETVSRAIRILCSEEYLSDSHSVLPAAIDLNMGCPVHKIVSNGEGSALMRDPFRAAEIARAAVEVSPVPVTVKLRAGWNAHEKNAPLVASLLEQAGVAAVCVHGRTRDQFYSGKCDRGVIREVKEAVSVPVIGNGDILTPEDAISMKRETGCDGVMIGRGAVGDPWIFARIAAAMDGQPYTPPSNGEIARTAKRHLREMCRQSGEARAVPEARRSVGAYLRDFPGAATARDLINRAKTASDIENAIDRVLLFHE